MKLLIIVGPTASGKSDIALQLAEKMDGEIISADSRQIYRGLDIGTAKPSLEERKKIPHHFVDEREITEPWSAVDFALEARTRLVEIISRGRQPIMVGGTGFYIKTFLDGLSDTTSTDDELRIKLTQKLNDEGLGSLLEELRDRDPQTYEKIDHNNPRRVLRALEKVSPTPVGARHALPLRGFNDEFEMIGIEWPREILYDRINKRVDEMMKQGLLDEIKLLAERGYDEKSFSALQTVGYQELFAYLRGEYSLDRAVELIKQHTRNYAKRQITWFQKDERIVWKSF